MTTALEVRAPASAIVVGGAPAPTPAEWDAFQSMAAWTFRSRMFSQYTNVEQVMMAMLLGRDLGIAPTAALAKGFIIEDGGRFKFDVEVQVKLAVVQARMPDFRYEVLEWTDEVCSLKGGMKGGQQVEIKVTLDEAKRRKWATKGDGTIKKTYLNNSKDMLMWRAQARILKLTAAGALYGALPAMFADSIVEEGDPEARSGAVVVDETPAGNGAAVASSPATPAAPQVVDERNYRRDFIARAKLCGWMTDAKQRDLANNGMRELGFAEVRNSREIAPADWKALYGWLDGRYDEHGKPRPKNGGVASPAGGNSVGSDRAPDVVPSEIEAPALPEEPEAPEAMGREEFVGVVNEIAHVFASAGHKRTFLTEHPPGSGRLFFMDAAILMEVGSTTNGAAKPFLVYAADDDAAGRNAVCSDSMVDMLLVKLKEAQRAIGR